MLLRRAIYISLALIWVLPQQKAHGADTVLLNQYDANGSLVSGDGKFYRYNDASQLVKVCEDAACAKTVAEYFYDHSGQRVKKIENGVTTYYIGKHYETQVVNGQMQNTNYYFANGERVAKKDATGTYFYHPDHLGGTSAVTNSSGLVVSSASYLPFGEVRQGGTESYSYTGKENDKGAGLYNFEARYVSPELRHFTQADVEEPDLDDPQDLNLYAYAGNNPLSYVDLDGYKKKKKAKLSKREKWMIAHGVDPDHDKTPLKKAKKLFKEGKKYAVATSSVASTNNMTQTLARNGLPVGGFSYNMAENRPITSTANVRHALTKEQILALELERNQYLAEAAYYSALADGYEETMWVTAKAALGAIGSVMTLGFGPAVMGAAPLGLADLGSTLLSGAVDIWDTYSDSKLSNTVSTGYSLIGYSNDLLTAFKWLH